MTKPYKILKAAGYRIDDIFAYTLKTWGEGQANAYINGLFQHFEKIAEHHIQWRKIPSEYGVNGYFSYYKEHVIFWRELPSGAIGISSVLSQKMNIPQHLQKDESENYL